MKLRFPLLLASAAIGLAACGGSPGQPTQQPGQPTQQPGQPTPATGQPTPIEPTPAPTAVGGAGTSTVHVVVASGPRAGTYDATGPKVDCNISPNGSGATYLDMSATGLYTVTFSSAEGGASPTMFYFNALFGGPTSTEPGIEIQTIGASPRGSGTASLQDNGSTIKWTINGTGEDGVGVQATVECGPVDRG